MISLSFLARTSSKSSENFSSSFCVRIPTTFSGRPFRTNCHIEAAAGSILHFILLFLPEDKFRHGQTAFRHGSDGILDNTRHAHKSSHSNRKISSYTIWNTISRNWNPNGSSAGGSAEPTTSKSTPHVRNITFSTCSPTRRAPACTSGTRWGTSLRTFSHATSASAVSTCCIRWATTPSVCRPNNTPSRRDSIRPSPPNTTSPVTANSSTRSASRSTGTAKCAPATRATTSGRSGPS